MSLIKYPQAGQRSSSIFPVTDVYLEQFEPSALRDFAYQSDVEIIVIFFSCPSRMQLVGN